jgi:8-oxo-dGTP pyrophosphatase MutT (NUDIX family)
MPSPSARLEAATAAALSEEQRNARLAMEARRGGPTGITPVDAATLILVDRAQGIPRVLMGRRHARHRFMPGLFVFPGGRRETADRHIPRLGELAEPVAMQLQARIGKRPRPALPACLALAAIRETFEETGLVLGRATSAAPAADLPGEWGRFAATGHLPDLSGLSFLARAITPPGRPKRFDTRFFVADAASIVHQLDGVVTPESELTELAWQTLDETVDLPLPPITRAVLADLDGAIRSGGPHPGAPVPFYLVRHGAFRRELIGG